MPREGFRVGGHVLLVFCKEVLPLGLEGLVCTFPPVVQLGPVVVELFHDAIDVMDQFW